MTEKDLKKYVQTHFPQENEKCEWKSFHSLKNNLNGKEGVDVLSYISAISNMNGGYLIVGVEDKTLNIVGIEEFHTYTCQNVKLKIIEQCINLPSEGFTIEEFYTSDTKKTIWVFQVPKHRPQLPVYAHKKAWQRIGDSLVAMTKERMDAILAEIGLPNDWSAEIVPDATLDDLDAQAIEKARLQFKRRNPHKADDVDLWDDATFLNKAKITKRNKITRTALILLGKEESEYLLSPAVVKIRWSLKTAQNENKDYEVFSIPMILAVDELYNKIRNVKYRYVGGTDTIFPEEMLQYDPFNIREPLNNCIAHQDYTKGARIEVVEYEDDKLIFLNHATFIPESVENVITKDCPESVYRNPYLVEAMRNINMIETEGGGIRKVFINQRKRLFPMPEYDLSGNKVKAEIVGKVLDVEFANIVAQNPELSLFDIMLLDKVQKKKALTDIEAGRLKKLRLIEGRKPNYYLSAKVLLPIDNKDLRREYIRNRSYDDAFVKESICKYIEEFKQVTKKDLESVFLDKLSNILTSKQKSNKIQNMLSALRMKGQIEYTGEFWVMKK